LNTQSPIPDKEIKTTIAIQYSNTTRLLNLKLAIMIQAFQNNFCIAVAKEDNTLDPYVVTNNNVVLIH
jgi:hypothetical protein